mgnify:CR=1 FL=1
MTIAEIIKKAARGEELNALEKAELEKFDPDAIASRADSAEAKLKEAEEKLDAAEQEKLSEAERYKKRAEAAEAKLKTSEEALRNAETERDNAKKEHAALIRSNRIHELAAKHKCEDADYLDYLVEKNSIDLSDEVKTNAFIEKLKKEQSKYFTADVKPGAGPGDPPKDQPPSKPVPNDRIGSIIEQLKNAPEVK